MTTPEFPAEQPAEAPHNLADWGTRALGYLIDFAPVFILGLIFRSGAISALISLASIGYFVYMGFLDGHRAKQSWAPVLSTRPGKSWVVAPE